MEPGTTSWVLASTRAAPWCTFPGARWPSHLRFAGGPGRNQNPRTNCWNWGEGVMAVDFTDRPAGESLARNADGRVLHTPVMADRILELLVPALAEPGSIYLDATLGMAGHAATVMAAAPSAHLIGIDRDGAALAVAREHLASFAERIHLVRARFDDLPAALAEAGVSGVQAMLIDLGLSSLQIDQPDRGFSYMADAPLDMRMDDRAELDAAMVINDYPPTDLVRILRQYGEERFADRIVRAIVRARAQAPVTSTRQLVDIVTAAIPMAVRRQSTGHPAKRVFQALRIEVNGELDALAALLPQALRVLTVGGRMAVLSYHSLEDRMVKLAFAKASTDSAPQGLPVVPVELQAQMKLLTRGAERPGEHEISLNPRAASARLRAVERIREVRP